MDTVPGNDPEALRAVIVSYVFPPVGGAGVQRTAKLARYLPDHWVQPVVLTCANPSAPVQDRSLLRDLAPHLRIVRARTLEPDYAVKRAAWRASAASSRSSVSCVPRALVSAARYALVPDPQVLWQPAAQWSLAQLMVQWNPDVVLISGPPFSTFLLAPLAHVRRNTAVVLDYRDEWSTYRTTHEMMPRVAAPLLRALEKALLRRADAVVTATRAFLDNLRHNHPLLESKPLKAIPNGYDPSDFPSDLPPPSPDRLVLTYAGTVFKLTSARGLLEAIRRVHEREPVLARALDVRFFGRIVDTELGAFEGMEALGVRRFGYVNHDRVLRELASSHLSLCLLDDLPGAERIYPAKIFELMHLRRPVLALSPPGELASLVREAGLGDVIAPRDVESIVGLLVRRLRQFRRGTIALSSQPIGAERYHRRALAGEFAAVMRDAMAMRRATAPWRAEA